MSILRNVLGVFCLLTSCATLLSAEPPTKSEESGPKTTVTAATPGAESTSHAKSSSGSTTTSSKSGKPPYSVVLKDAQAVPGVINVYKKGNRVFAELSSADYATEYIVLISIARGIGREPVLGGFSWIFGDDWVWKFRKVDDRVQVVRRNVRFRANKQSPEATAVKAAYTDSVLFSLPIITKGPKGGDLVDLNSIFMSDLPRISRFLPGFIFSSIKSTWASIKGFKDNLQLEVAATYSSSGRIEIDSIPDSRGATINVHYSLSRVPNTGYVPRLADDRVGYFVTVVKDYSKQSDRDQFVRYVNRWQLQKPPGASGTPTPPKKPIIFWIERTVPFAYRKPVREGIAEWNKAFEAAGWLNAIEVRQQPDDATWDPEDINYNTFRWITSDAGFAMGASRVNPYTGQILDADIIFDADFLLYWKREFETLDPHAIAAMTGGPRTRDAKGQATAELLLGAAPRYHACWLAHGMTRQMAVGAAAVQAEADPKKAAELQNKLIMQGLKETVMHEVGHTLGLRHNFKGSRYLSLKDLNDVQKVRQHGMVASVMDYNATNIVPKGMKQGDFFATTIGPYDMWAIQYGYKPLSGGTKGEVKELQKIAARSGEPALAYATDEDTTSISPDPDSNRFDLGKDSLEWARAQAKLVADVMPGLIDRMTKPGEDYTRARRAFNVLLSQHGSAMYFVTRYVGGYYTSRSHKGDKDAKPPLRPVEAAKQRAALNLVLDQVFGPKAYTFPAGIYAYLMPSNWQHWGVLYDSRRDLPLHEVVLMWQSRMLDHLLSSLTLERIYDAELVTPANQDVLTCAELLERMTKSIFAEVGTIKPGKYTPRRPAITSLRRNLQREYLRELSNLALGRTLAPADCQSIAGTELADLKTRIDAQLAAKVSLDGYTRAHLRETAQRIQKVLDARIMAVSP